MSRKSSFWLFLLGLLAFVLVSVPAASAHQGGQVELFVAGLSVSRSTGGYEVTARVVDRDSGDAAGGFKVTITGAAEHGQNLPATALIGKGDANYAALIALAPGVWKLNVAAEQGDSTVSAIGSNRNFTVRINADGSVSLGGGGSGSGAAIAAVLGAVVVVALVAVFAVARRRRSRSQEATHA